MLFPEHFPEPSAALRQCLIDCYPQAEGWLGDWQHHLTTLCERWKLHHLRWVPDLSYYPVFFVEPVGVLKLFPPGPEASR